MANKYGKPYCRLNKALYGHPESGGHWERHLTEKVKLLKGRPIYEHPSSFFFERNPLTGEAWQLLLTVYVDDLLLSGPAPCHDEFWRQLRRRVELEDPEPIDRFLGRKTHVVRV